MNDQAQQKTINLLMKMTTVTTIRPTTGMNTPTFSKRFLQSPMFQWLGQKFQRTIQTIVEQELMLHLKLT